MEKQALYIDPRTKLFLLLVMNIVMLDTSSGVLLPYLRFIIGFLPFVLLLTSKSMGLPGDIPNQSHHCLVCIRLYQWIYDDAVGISIIDGYKIFAWWNAWSVFFL